MLTPHPIVQRVERDLLWAVRQRHGAIQGAGACGAWRLRWAEPAARRNGRRTGFHAGVGRQELRIVAVLALQMLLPRVNAVIESPPRLGLAVQATRRTA